MHYRLAAGIRLHADVSGSCSRTMQMTAPFLTGFPMKLRAISILSRNIHAVFRQIKRKKGGAHGTPRENGTYAHSVTAQTAAMSTMSSTEQPRLPSTNGLRRPLQIGPIAVAPPRRSVAL